MLMVICIAYNCRRGLWALMVFVDCMYSMFVQV